MDVPIFESSFLLRYFSSLHHVHLVNEKGWQGCQPSNELQTLERKVNAQFTPDGARDEGGGGRYVSDGLAKGRGVGNGASEIVSVVCPIGQVEGLRDQLNVHLFPNFDVLGEFDIQF